MAVLTVTPLARFAKRLHFLDGLGILATKAFLSSPLTGPTKAVIDLAV